MPPRKRSRYSVARRGYGSSYRPRSSNFKNKLIKAENSLKRLRSKTRNSKVPNAIKGSAAVLAGAAAAGAITGYGYPQIMGIDTDVALGVAAVAAGVAMGKPTSIYFGAGCLTSAVSVWSREKAVEFSQAG